MNSLSDYILTLRPNKVALITSMYPPYPEGVQQLWGGVEIDLEDLVSSLTKEGVDVRILSFDYIKPMNGEQDLVERVGIYTPYVLFEGRRKFLDFAYKEFFRPIIFKGVLRYLDKEKPDYVVIGKTYQFSLAIYAACRLLNIPYIIRYDWSCPSNPKDESCTFHDKLHCTSCIERTTGVKIPKIGKIAAPLYFLPLFALKKLFWNKSLKVTVVSQFFQNVAISFGVDPGKIIIIPPTSKLSVDKKKIEDLRDSLNKENFFLVLYAGRLEPEKGINVLLDAFTHNSLKNEKIKLLVVGTGRMADLVQEISRKDPRIMYAGLIPHEEIGNYFAIADLIAIPSIVPESYCLVAEEALSLGKKIIGFNMGGLKELAERDKKVILIQMGVENLARGIKSFIYKDFNLRNFSR